MQTPLWQHRRPPKSTARRSPPQPRHRQLSHRPVDFALRAPSARSAAAAERASDAMATGRRFGGLAVRPRAASTATGLTPSTSASGLGSHHLIASGLGSPLPHLHRDWARPICIGTGLSPATSAPGRGACGKRALLRIAGDRASEHARTRSSASARAHTHAHTHALRTHARTHAHTYGHTHTHTRQHAHTHAHTHFAHARARTRIRTRMHMRGHRCTRTTYERARTAPMPLNAHLRKQACSTRALLCFAMHFSARQMGCAAHCGPGYQPTAAPAASDSRAGSPPRPAFAAQSSHLRPGVPVWRASVLLGRVFKVKRTLAAR